MTLKDLDLNLLLALDALIQERHVTRASKRLGLSQGATSNALNRLRAALDDPILVREGSAMVPTPRALALMPPVRDALATLERALAQQPFLPQLAPHTFSLLTSREAANLVLPALWASTQEIASNVTLASRCIASFEAISARPFDLALLAHLPSTLPAHLHAEPLICMTPRCMLSPAHPQLKTLSPELLEPHEELTLAASQLGGPQAYRVPDLGMLWQVFGARPRAWCMTDEVWAAMLTAHHGLICAPWEPEPVSISMVWPAAREHEPALGWLRDQVRAVALDSRFEPAPECG